MDAVLLLPARRIAWLLPLLLASCGRDDGRSSPPPLAGGGSAGTHASGGDAGQAAGGGSAGAGGSAGQAGAGSGGAGGAGGGVSGNCGNGKLDAVEQCDGKDLAGNDCKALGYDGGTLSCAPGCFFDEAGCVGAEKCADGLDNDQDGKPDCDDADCQASCADACSAPPAVADPGTVSGTTAGHASKLDASCSGNPSGGEVVYTFTPKTTGVAEAWLTSNKPLTLSLRSSCVSAGSELACAVERVKAKATAGQPLFVSIEGHDAADSGAFVLSISSRAVSCGDAHRDEPEACDDGNTASGDGCSASCAVEPSESEPNASSAQASTYSAPYFAEIAPSGDEDWVKLSLAASQAPASLVADTFDLGDGACSKQELDSELALFAADGSSLLASDDDSGVGGCAHLVASGLGAGTYYLKVSASSQGVTPVFPYRLAVAFTKQ